MNRLFTLAIALLLGAALTAVGAAEKAKGQIVSVDEASITIQLKAKKGQEATELVLSITDETSITLDGGESDAASLAAGQEANVTYEDDAAVSIAAKAPKQKKEKKAKKAKDEDDDEDDEDDEDEGDY